MVASKKLKIIIIKKKQMYMSESLKNKTEPITSI